MARPSCRPRLEAGDGQVRALADLVKQLRGEVELLRRRGLEREARLEESIAEDVELALRDYAYEELPLREAAAESGYSVKRLRELVHEGKIPDGRPDGTQGEIRIRRCDLPRKPASHREPSPVDLLELRVRGNRE